MAGTNYRKLKPSEINHLLKFGFDPSKIQDETPVEYITGFAEFYRRDFKVSSLEGGGPPKVVEGVLIPRIETEELIDIALKSLATQDFASLEKITFADIGTGSGCIGITFALEIAKLNFDFEGYLSDISEIALKIAKHNLKMVVETQNLASLKPTQNESQYKKLKIIKSNLLENYPKNKKFDIIFANLPYIPSSRIDKLDKSVKDFEPQLALDGGEDGLKYIRNFLNQAKNFLNEHAFILLEVDDNHTDSSEFEKDWVIEIRNDQFGKNRFWMVYPKW